MNRPITVRDAVNRTREQLVCTLLGCLCLPSLAYGSSTVDICQEPATGSHLSIGYVDNATASFEGSIGDLNRDNFSTDLLFDLNNNWTLGFGHRSAVLNVDRLMLQTNGYLHSFFFPAHWRRQSDKSGFRFSIAPGLSASSNVTADPDEYASDALQLLAAFVWERQISDRLRWSYGLCGDHRFGDYRVYPVVSLAWQLHPDWRAEIGFPTSQLSYRISESLGSSLRIAPNGNEWYVKDESLGRHSQLVHEVWVIEWVFKWWAHPHFVLTASVGREFQSRYEMTLFDESLVRLASEPAARAGVVLTWIF